MDPTKIRPVGPFVLLKTLPKKEKTEGGVLVLPETEEDKVGFVWAEVIAVGQGEYTKKGALARARVEPGEVVLVRRYLTEVTQLPNYWQLPDHHGFVHQKDLIGVRDEDFEFEVTRI